MGLKQMKLLIRVDLEVISTKCNILTPESSRIEASLLEAEVYLDFLRASSRKDSKPTLSSILAQLTVLISYYDNRNVKHAS